MRHHEVSWLEYHASWAKPLGAVIATVLAGMALLAQLDAALLRHLDATFASRADLQRTEEHILSRIDTLEKKLYEFEP